MNKEPHDMVGWDSNFDEEFECMEIGILDNWPARILALVALAAVVSWVFL